MVLRKLFYPYVNVVTYYCVIIFYEHIVISNGSFVAIILTSKLYYERCVIKSKKTRSINKFREHLQRVVLTREVRLFCILEFPFTYYYLDIDTFTGLSPALSNNLVLQECNRSQGCGGTEEEEVDWLKGLRKIELIAHRVISQRNTHDDEGQIKITKLVYPESFN